MKLVFRLSHYKSIGKDLIKLTTSHSSYEFSKTELQRVREYTILVHIIADLICHLRGEKLQAKEKEALLYFSACAPLMDDLYDDNLSQTVQKKELFLHFTERLNPFVSHKEIFEESYTRLQAAQEKSKMQSASHLNRPDIEQITADKGGYSALLLRSIFNHDFKPGEKEAFFKSGELFQMMDDIFDVYTDSRQGIKTIPLYYSEINELKAIFISKLIVMQDLFDGLAYPEQQKRTFIFRLSFLLSRTFVCLEQYKKLQRQNNGIFNAQDFSRKELVCDMEKARNIGRWVFWTVGFSEYS